MNAHDFTAALDQNLSPLVRNERTLVARFSSMHRAFQSMIFVNFINLPEERHRQKRGGGAESENNRMLFTVEGFGEHEEDPSAPKLKVEQSVHGLFEFRRMRTKTASPEKIAEYLAGYINEVAETIPPNFTHA